MKQSSECLVNNKDLYQLQVGNMTVEFKYSENNKKINECMINVLRQKTKWADILYWARYTIREGREK